MAERRVLVDPSLVDAESITRELNSDRARGISESEAARRLAERGPNALREATRTATWRKILAQFQDPLVCLLLASVVVSFVAWVSQGAVGWPVDALVIGLIVVLNAVLGYAQEARAENAVAALQRMVAASSAVVRGGQLMRVESTALVPGDLLVLDEGDFVGADARLLEANTLRVQEAALTGESEPVFKNAATLPAKAALGDRANMVWKGTAVVRGTGRAMITATGMETQMGAIAKLLDSAVDTQTPLSREIARVGRMLGIAVVLIAAAVVGTIFFVSEMRSTQDVVDALLLGVSLAVAAVPEGLPAILSVVLALGVQRMAKRNAIVKSLSSVETLGSASVICSDKTGTLTRSEMTIERVMTASGCTSITGVGYAPVGEVEHPGDAEAKALARAESLVVLGGGSVANNAELQHKRGTWEIQGDPTEAAFLVAEQKLGTHERRKRRFERIGEIPFSSERKRMSTLARDLEHDGQLVMITKGAPEMLVSLCTRVRVGMEVRPLDETHRARIARDVAELSEAALRTLSVAYRPLSSEEATKPDESLERELIFVGTVGIIDPARPEARVSVEHARKAGVRVLMITGDHPRTASRIARDLGIVPEGAPTLTGNEIDAWGDEELAQAVRKTSVYARVAPEHKLRIVPALQADDHVVAMTGDGVNDAPALKAADIGVAMGVTGTEVTKEAADMILADDNFATIVTAVREGRSIFDNIKKFLRYLLSSNMGEVLTIFLGVVLAQFIGLPRASNGVVLPLLATQVLWINLVTDSGPALAMGVDPETEDVMARPPRRRNERVLDTRMWLGVLLSGATMAASTLLTMDLYLPGGLIEGSDDLVTARTGAFTALVCSQLVNCLCPGSDTSSAFRHVFANHWLWAAIALSGLLQVAVIHVGALNTAFGPVPLRMDQSLVCIAMASSVLCVSELRKLVLRVLP